MAPSEAWARERAEIAVLAGALDRRGVRYWLMGGWAVDSHLGRTTRPHSDIDFAVYLDDRDRLVEALGAHGYVSVPGADPSGEFFEGGPCRVEITYLVDTPTGDVVTPGFEHWPFLAGSLADLSVDVDGVAVRIVSVAGLIDTKEHWHVHIGEPLRPHDQLDLDALRRLAADDVS